MKKKTKTETQIPTFELSKAMQRKTSPEQQQFFADFTKYARSMRFTLPHTDYENEVSDENRNVIIHNIAFLAIDYLNQPRPPKTIRPPISQIKTKPPLKPKPKK